MEIEEDSVSTVDSTFIGIPPAKCHELLNSPNEIYDAAVQDKDLVPGPSIVDLKSNFKHSVPSFLFYDDFMRTV